MSQPKYEQRRIGLHQYDPKDLSSDLAMDQTLKSKEVKPQNVEIESKPVTVQDKEILRVSTEGLQIDSNSAEGCVDVAGGQFKDCTGQDDGDFDKWENTDENYLDFDESDDDLL